MSLEVPGWSTEHSEVIRKSVYGRIGLTPAVIRRLTFTKESKFVRFDSLWHNEY